MSTFMDLSLGGANLCSSVPAHMIDQSLTYLRFLCEWSKFCKDPEATLMKGRPASDILTDLVLNDHQVV